MSQALTPHGYLIISSILPPIAGITVGLRFYSRRTQKAPLGIDDWIMLPALALLVALGIIGIYGVKVDGYGKPAPAAAINGTTGSGVGPTAYAFQLFLVATLGRTKIGALLFYRRIFCLKQPFGIFDIAVYGMIIIVSLWAIAFLISGAAFCGSHPSASWTGAENYFKYCVIAFQVNEAFAISDFLLDILIIVVPIPKIWSLKMPTSRKIGTTLVFLSALVSLAAATTRMVEVLQIFTTGTSGVADPRLEDTRSNFWSMLEAGLALIVSTCHP